MTYDYQEGYCHYFADIIIDDIRKLVPNNFPINYYLILAERYDDEGELLEDVLIHAYIKIGNYYLDSEGFHTIDKVNERQKQWVDTEESITPEGYDFYSHQEETDSIPQHFFNTYCKTSSIKKDIQKFILQPQFKEFISKLKNR
jgi:hypothetical protein